jgi:hypothetical protein
MNEKRRIDSRSRISELRSPGSLPQRLVHLILPLLLKNPGLLMIGLDTQSSQAVPVSGKEAKSLTLNPIREIIEWW